MSNSLGRNQDGYRAALARGAFVNAVGLIAKVVQPGLLIVLTALFGPTTTGVYLVATLTGDMLVAGIVSGYSDAMTLFGSRAQARDPSGDAFYETVGAIARTTMGVSLGLSVVGLFVAEPIARGFFAEHQGLPHAFVCVALTLPMLSLSYLATSASKAEMRMEYDVGIWGFARPMAILLACIVARLFGGGIDRLMIAYALAHVAVAAIGFWSLARHFDLGRAVRATLRGRRVPELHTFSLPQNLNMMLNRYQGRIDVLALASLGFTSAQVAFYGTGALIAGSLQEVRLVFSSALAPIAARHHAEGDRNTLEATLGKVSRWTITLVVPLAVLVVVYRGEILRLIDASYVGDSRFVVVLMLAPVISCAIGLAGNFLVFTGHSGWNLTNSLIAAALNTSLNFALIPHWSLIGAATATATTAAFVAVAQLLELRYVERVKLRWSLVYKPYLALLPVLAMITFVWDPAVRNGLLRMGVTLGSLALYGAMLLGLGHDEAVAAWAKVRGRLST